jgi:uncharacterized membrane protein
MAMAEGLAGSAAPTSIPVRRITSQDLDAALREGFADFASKRGDLIFIGIIYPVVGLFASFAALNMSVWELAFPLAAGISLLGPLVATGFYELAKRREAGVESNWWHFLDVLRSRSRDEIAIVGLMLIGLFVLWMAAAAMVHTAFFGTALHPPSLGVFVRQVFETEQGWGMIIVGNLVGLCFAVAALALSVVSLPLLVDREVDAGTAVRTSLRAFRENKGVMLRWGLTVAVLLVLGSIPFFVGLAVVLPVLGYATWHLYTRLIDRNALPPA